MKSQSFFAKQSPVERVGVGRKAAHFPLGVESRQPPAEGLESTKNFELQKKKKALRLEIISKEIVSLEKYKMFSIFF